MALRRERGKEKRYNEYGARNRPSEFQVDNQFQISNPFHPDTKFGPAPDLQAQKNPGEFTPPASRPEVMMRASAAGRRLNQYQERFMESDPIGSEPCCDKEILADINGLNTQVASLGGPDLQYKVTSLNCQKFWESGFFNQLLTSIDAIVEEEEDNVFYNELLAQLEMGGGGSNQKGGGWPQMMVILKHLLRFLRRSAVCGLLHGATQLIKSILTKMVVKFFMMGVSAAPTAFNATAAAAAGVATAPTTATVIGTAMPYSLLAGIVIALGFEILNFIQNDGFRGEGAADRAQALDQQIDAAQRVAGSRNLNQLAREVEQRFLDEQKVREISEGFPVLLANMQLENYGMAAEEGTVLWQRLTDTFRILNMVKLGYETVDQIVDFFAYLPDNMVGLLDQILREPNQHRKILLYRELKTKSMLLLLLMGAGLPSPIIQILLVPVASFKIGETGVDTVTAIYNAGFGNAAAAAARPFKDALVNICEELAEVQLAESKAKKKELDDALAYARGHIESLKQGVSDYNELIARGKVRAKSAEGSGIVAATAAAVEALVEAVVEEELSAPAGVPGAAAPQFAGPGDVSGGGGGGENQGGGSRRRRKNNKPRKRKTLRKKSKRRKSTKRNSRKTTVRRKSRRLSRKSKRLSRKLKK